MSPKLILTLLGRVATALFYLSILYCICWVVVSLIGIFDGGFDYPSVWKPYYEVKQLSLPIEGAQSGIKYSADSLIKYSVANDKYVIFLKPRSATGYYTFVSSLISLGLMLLIAKTFMDVLKQTKVDEPFHKQLVGKLHQLAFLYIFSSIFSIVHYFIFSAFLVRSLIHSSLHLDLVDLIKNDFTIGTIIWIVAIIFQRGIEIQEENALTV